ncbi:MAG: hypothetical protein OHK0028_12850 [Deltaproteobacteria bacterium]
MTAGGRTGTRRLIVPPLCGALLLAGFPAIAGQGDPKGKALFEEKCSTCHTLSRPMGRNKDRGGWSKTVDRMQKVNGCPITDAEAEEIVNYLVAVRGPAGR